MHLRSRQPACTFIGISKNKFSIGKEFNSHRFGTARWQPFHCRITAIQLPWRFVKTKYYFRSTAMSKSIVIVRFSQLLTLKQRVLVDSGPITIENCFVFFRHTSQSFHLAFCFTLCWYWILERLKKYWNTKQHVWHLLRLCRSVLNLFTE